MDLAAFPLQFDSAWRQNVFSVVRALDYMHRERTPFQFLSTAMIRRGSRYDYGQTSSLYLRRLLVCTSKHSIILLGVRCLENVQPIWVSLQAACTTNTAQILHKSHQHPIRLNEQQ